jgi:hypothetical protein
MHFATEERCRKNELPSLLDALGSVRWGRMHDGNAIAVEEAKFCITMQILPPSPNVYRH